MCNNANHRSYYTIAKQAGFMPTSWFANNSLSLDRTPEIKIGVRSNVV